MIKRILISIGLLLATPVMAQEANLVDMKPVPEQPGVLPSNFPRYLCLYQAQDGHVESRVLVFTCPSRIKVRD